MGDQENFNGDINKRLLFLEGLYNPKVNVNKSIVKKIADNTDISHYLMADSIDYYNVASSIVDYIEEKISCERFDYNFFNELKEEYNINEDDLERIKLEFCGLL